jgi:hypothetical protein
MNLQVELQVEVGVGVGEGEAQAEAEMVEAVDDDPRTICAPPQGASRE